MVNRIDELKFVKECIEKQRSLVITGEKGVGKTYMLRLIEANFRACYIETLSKKNILLKLITSLKISTKRSPRYMTEDELLTEIIPALKRKQKVILLDNCDSVSKPVARLLEKLGEITTIVAATEKRTWNYRFREEHVLKPLDRNSTKELAGKLLNTKDRLVLELVATKSLGNPGKVLELCRDYSIALERFDVDPLDRNSIVKFFLDERPQIPERVNIFPVWALFVIGFGLLIVKYFFFSQADWSAGYMFASFGYASLIVYRLASERRRR